MGTARHKAIFDRTIKCLKPYSAVTLVNEPIWWFTISLHQTLYKLIVKVLSHVCDTENPLGGELIVTLEFSFTTFAVLIQILGLDKLLT